MKLSFYPGCSLEGLAGDYALSIHAVFRALEIDFTEIEDWSCCGSTAAHSLDQFMSIVLPARNLSAAEKMGRDMVTPCAMCFNRLRYSLQMIRKGLYDGPWKMSGDLQVHDMTRFLAEPDRISAIRQRISKPLVDLKIVCYYGCQMVRPPKITGYTDYENPLTLDRIGDSLGASVIDWSYKSTCCGASIGIARKDIQASLTRRILVKAKQAGAEAVMVSCPLCQSNLDMFQIENPQVSLPVFYFTELVRLAFEPQVSPKIFRKHIANPLPLLRRKGFFQ
jgi:heterodisulfide reductase subunit B